MITVAESESDVRITTNTPYLALTGELWGVCCEDFGENWRRYNGTALYLLPLVAVMVSDVLDAWSVISQHPCWLPIVKFCYFPHGHVVGVIKLTPTKRKTMCSSWLSWKRKNWNLILRWKCNLSQANMIIFGDCTCKWFIRASSVSVIFCLFRKFWLCKYDKAIWLYICMWL